MRWGGPFGNRGATRGCSGQTVFSESTQKKSAVGLKRAVPVAVKDIILAQVSDHPETEPVSSDRALDGNPGHRYPVQHFLLDGRAIGGRDCSKDGRTDSFPFQPVGNLPGLLRRFRMVRLKGIDGSQDSQGFAGPEGLRIAERGAPEANAPKSLIWSDILAQMACEVNRVGRSAACFRVG